MLSLLENKIKKETHTMRVPSTVIEITWRLATYVIVMYTDDVCKRSVRNARLDPLGLWSVPKSPIRNGDHF